MPNTALLLTLAASVFAGGDPYPVGAPVAPDFITPATRTVTLKGLCPHGARPTDVTVTDLRGRQYRTRSNGRRWIDREGVTVAVRRGSTVTTYLTRRGYVYAWCGGQD